MLALSQSFSMGSGNLEHNLRITRGAGVRQNGYVERRHLNEHVIVRGDVTQKDYEKNLLRQVVAERIGDELKAYNERMIQNKHPERVMTVEQWIAKKQYTRGGKQKKLISEYIVNLGNRHTACPYKQRRNSHGQLLDKNRDVIPLWDTRRAADYAHGKIIESDVSKIIKPILREFVTEFKKKNPRAEIVGYSIHCDEGGAIHAHLTVVWWSKLKPLKNGKTQGVGWGIAQSEAIRQQYAERGIKCNNERKDNPLTRWRKDMVELLEEVALRHGVQRLDMGNKEKHRSVREFGKYKDVYCDELEKELEKQKQEVAEKDRIVSDKVSSDIAKQEWYILKKRYPEMYEKIHKEFLLNKEKKQKILDNSKSI